MLVLRASLSCFQVFLPQVTPRQRLDGLDPVWNISVDRAGIPVCPELDAIYWVLHIFIECWSHVPLSHIFKFFLCRLLHQNSLTGTTPSQILTLTKLKGLYVPESERIYWVLAACFIDCWSCAPLSSFSRGLLFRYLCQNKLGGTISAQISALVELNELYVLTSFH